MVKRLPVFSSEHFFYPDDICKSRINQNQYEHDSRVQLRNIAKVVNDSNPNVKKCFLNDFEYICFRHGIVSQQ